MTQQKPSSPRNVFVVAMNKRHTSGKMRSKKDKRQSGKNKQREILKDSD